MSNTNAVRNDIRILKDNENLGEVGAVVFWNSHGTVSHAKLTNNWTMAGLDPKLLMDLPSPKVALRRAVQAMQEAHILARRLKDTWILKRERPVEEENDLAYETEAKVSLNAVGQLVLEPDNVEPALKSEIEAHYKVYLTHLTHEDMSLWLVDLTSAVGAIALRDRGGFYFVTANGLRVWRVMAKVIEESSHYEMHDIPADRSMNVAKAVMAGLSNEIKVACAEMERDLMSGEHGERALGARVKRCDSLVAKIEDFEPIVGRTLNELTTGVEALQARLAAAALVASSDN